MKWWRFILRDCVLSEPKEYRTFPCVPTLAETLVAEGVVPYQIKRHPILLKIIANSVVLSLLEDAHIDELFFYKNDDDDRTNIKNLRRQTYDFADQLRYETGICLQHYYELNNTLGKVFEL